MDSQNSPISLKDGAIFVADVHYQRGIRQELDHLLQWLLHQPPPQLLLMGDIFDLLVGTVPSTIERNSRPIQQLRQLSELTECHYFEGNHDFNLASLFPKMRVYPREVQPVIFEAAGRRIALAHGDLCVGSCYEYYCTWIRKESILRLLDIFNVGDWIVERVLRRSAQKNLCRSIPRFHQIIERKLATYPRVDLIIEGHFHQNYFTRRYINLPAFGCTRSVVLYQNRTFREVAIIEWRQRPSRPLLAAPSPRR
ncbi:MAG: UDP-2,3-diacylglucosamine diphosphatase [Epsilonproteobacteria bacterium]|nr:UDP-2,3-diacylglucosamine diphosphatase [Campylobacterota bacterium]